MSLLLGLVQGIAEFLPVSSSGHLAILQSLLSGENAEEHMFFNVLLHIGTLISICVVYRSEIRTMISDMLEFFRKRAESDLGEPVVLKPSARALLFVIVGTLPMVIVVFFLGAVDRLFANTAFIGFALIITGGILFVSDKYVNRGNKTEKTMTMLDAVFVGLAQAVAVIPGLSRSGTTIVVGLVRGFTGPFAVKFSLLLSIPAVFCAMIVELFRAIRGGINFPALPVYLAGFVVAVVIGFFAIQLIRRIMTKSGFGNFAFYCWGVGALTLILSFIL